MYNVIFIFVDTNCLFCLSMYLVNWLLREVADDMFSSSNYSFSQNLFVSTPSFYTVSE